MSRHLGVGIAPGAELQAAANPAEAFGGIGSAVFGAHNALRTLHGAGFDGSAGAFDQGLRGECVRNR